VKVALVGKNSSDLQVLLEDFEFEVQQHPEEADVIIVYGGDGALIGAEFDYPDIPKLAIRDNNVCEKCRHHQDDAVLKRLGNGEMPTTELPKLLAQVGNAQFQGLNDILLRNHDIRSAVRFCVYVNDEQATDEVIGDGLVVATPFGSSAYFRSITNVTFRSGIGIAFNNVTEFINHFVLKESDEIRVHIVRGPAEVTSDNNPNVVHVESGDNIVIVAGETRAKILAVDTLRCSHCRYRHAPRRRF